MPLLHDILIKQEISNLRSKVNGQTVTQIIDCLSISADVNRLALNPLARHRINAFVFFVFDLLSIRFDVSRILLNKKSE